MNIYEQIVRELVATEPEGEYYPPSCRFCGGLERQDPEPHAADCLWLRAKQAVERADNPSIRITIHERKPEPEVIVVPVPYPGPGGGMRA
jgi:hypothetical protein